MRWLDKLERKFGKYYIPNLMWGVISLSAVVYVITFFILGDLSYIFKLMFSPNAIMNGEVWRLVTFVLIPPITTNAFMVVLALYFDYLAGVNLEHEWGGFKFNVYFFFGMISTIIVSFITGVPASGSAVMLSIFLAFAKLFPKFIVNVFFVLPIEVKWLGYLAWGSIILGVGKALYSGSIPTAILQLVPVVNYLIFFGGRNYKDSKMRAGSVIRMSEYKKSMKSVKKDYNHKCTVCGITDIENPDMTFRYCSKCAGKHAYCEKHIRDHEHIE